MADAQNRVVTTHVYPPIPIRTMDWSAHYDDDEPNDAGGMDIGYGATEREAVADLLENHPRDGGTVVDYHDQRECPCGEAV